MSVKSRKISFALAVRKIMVPPVMSVLFLTALLCFRPEFYARPADYIAAIVGIAVFPVLAYPISSAVPKLKKKGREGQRNLAFIFSSAGYLLSFCYSFLPGRTAEFRLIALIYVLSVVMLLIFNKLLGIRASGHSCAISGPMAACLLLVGPASLPVCLVLFTLSFWSSVVTGRHTSREFLMGAFANLIAGILAVLILPAAVLF